MITMISITLFILAVVSFFLAHNQKKLEQRIKAIEQQGDQSNDSA